MHLLLKLVSSPWFWLDVVLSMSGGLVVRWGLIVEKKAGQLTPPPDFRHDIFDDISEAQKRESERGWRILMAGIVMEVIAAFGISIISGLEMAELTNKSDQAQKDAAESRQIAATTELNNLLLRSNVAELETKVIELETKAQWRAIKPEDNKKFIEFLKNAPKGGIGMGVNNPNSETANFADKVCQMLIDSGYSIESHLNYGKVLEFPKSCSIAFMIKDDNSNPNYYYWLKSAFLQIGYNIMIVTNGLDSGIGKLNKVIICIGEKN